MIDFGLGVLRVGGLIDIVQLGQSLSLKLPLGTFRPSPAKREDSGLVYHHTINKIINLRQNKYSLPPPPGH